MVSLSTHWPATTGSHDISVQSCPRRRRCFRCCSWLLNPLRCATAWSTRLLAASPVSPLQCSPLSRDFLFPFMRPAGSLSSMYCSNNWSHLRVQPYNRRYFSLLVPSVHKLCFLLIYRSSTVQSLSKSVCAIVNRWESEQVTLKFRARVVTPILPPSKRHMSLFNLINCFFQKCLLYWLRPVVTPFSVCVCVCNQNWIICSMNYICAGDEEVTRQWAVDDGV